MKSSYPILLNLGKTSTICYVAMAAYPGLEVHDFLKSLNKVFKSFLTCALIDIHRAGTIYKDTQWAQLRTFAKNIKGNKVSLIPLLPDEKVKDLFNGDQTGKSPSLMISLRIMCCSDWSLLLRRIPVKVRSNKCKNYLLKTFSQQINFLNTTQKPLTIVPFSRWPRDEIPKNSREI